MAKYVFPAVFEFENGMYGVAFPDLDGCYTCGDNLADALSMAEDVLGGWLTRAEEKGVPIPPASEASGIITAENSFITLVLADTSEYRRKHSGKAVKKTLSIPSWLNEAAEARAINFSKVLQDALCEQLGFEK